MKVTRFGAMPEEFEQELAEMEENINEVLLEYYDLVERIKGKDINSFNLIQTQINPVDIDKAIKAYKKVGNGFRVLFSLYIIKNEREYSLLDDGSEKWGNIINPEFSPLDSNAWNKNKLNKFGKKQVEEISNHIEELKSEDNLYPTAISQINFRAEDVKSLADAIYSGNHKSFYTLLYSIIKKKNLCEKYTRAIFKKAPKHI